MKETSVSAESLPKYIWRKSLYFREDKTWWYEPIWIVKASNHRLIVHDIDGRRFTLDRDKLEKQGWVWHASSCRSFYLKKGDDAAESVKEWYERTVSNRAAQALQLPETYTVDDIKSAYKRLALKHHPDVGGDHEAFLAVNEAYEKLMLIEMDKQSR